MAGASKPPACPPPPSISLICKVCKQGFVLLIFFFPPHKGSSSFHVDCLVGEGAFAQVYQASILDASNPRNNQKVTFKVSSVDSE